MKNFKTETENVFLQGENIIMMFWLILKTQWQVTFICNYRKNFLTYYGQDLWKLIMARTITIILLIK